MGNANFSWANLNSADLEGADFHGSNLQYSTAISANLQEVNFDDSNFESADLTDANMWGAHLHRARFYTSTVGGVDFTYAAFKYNEVWGWYRTGATFTYATGCATVTPSGSLNNVGCAGGGAANGTGTDGPTRPAGT
jgi:uncharacterized protein YjbI with pentapeptide repeats